MKKLMFQVGFMVLVGVAYGVGVGICLVAYNEISAKRAEKRLKKAMEVDA